MNIQGIPTFRNLTVPVASEIKQYIIIFAIAFLIYWLVEGRNKQSSNPQGYSEKDWTTALLLCIFLGWQGMHRFYTGKRVSAVLWLFTLGFFGIGWLLDTIMIVCGTFRDSTGRRLKTK